MPALLLLNRIQSSPTGHRNHVQFLFFQQPLVVFQFLNSVIRFLTSLFPLESYNNFSLPPCKREVRKRIDRKSTRLNSSHVAISYAVFCLKKKKNITHK